MSNEELIAEAECARGAYSLDSETVALIDRMIDALRAAERKPVIDREALVEFFGWHPDPNSVADHFMRSFSIEDKREAQAEALEAAADAAVRLFANRPGAFSHWLRARAATIREAQQ